MELNLVPLIEAAKGLTWQGAAVLICALIAAVLMSWMRLVHGDKEREFWKSATPEQTRARAATTATLPPPTKAPPLPILPLAILLLLGACAIGTGSAGARRLLPGRCRDCVSARGTDFAPDLRPAGLYASGVR